MDKFNEETIPELKKQIKQKFTQQFNIEQIKANLKTEKIKEKKDELWKELSAETLSFMSLALCCESQLIYAHFLSNVLISKYESELENYFSP